MTQNGNESLHLTIWNLCPKGKYSPQSISTAIAVIYFNEGEVSLFGLLNDLKLHPSYVSFRSLCKRDQIGDKHRAYFKKANMDRRTRRQKLTKERCEKDLRLETSQVRLVQN